MIRTPVGTPNRVNRSLDQPGVPGRIERSEKGGDLVGRHPAIHRLIFGQIADAAADFERLRRGIEPHDFDPATGRREQAQQRANQGRLAGPVAAEQGKGLALGYFQRNVVEHRALAIADATVIDLDGRGGS